MGVAACIRNETVPCDNPRGGATRGRVDVQGAGSRSDECEGVAPRSHARPPRGAAVEALWGRHLATQRCAISTDDDGDASEEDEPKANADRSRPGLALVRHQSSVPAARDADVN